MHADNINANFQAHSRESSILSFRQRFVLLYEAASQRGLFCARNTELEMSLMARGAAVPLSYQTNGRHVLLLILSVLSLNLK